MIRLRHFSSLRHVHILMRPDVPDGATFVEAVRRQRPSTPVLVMAGYCGNAGDASYSTLGSLSGPVDLDGLVAEIERWLPP